MPGFNWKTWNGRWKKQTGGGAWGQSWGESWADSWGQPVPTEGDPWGDSWGQETVGHGREIQLPRFDDDEDEILAFILASEEP